MNKVLSIAAVFLAAAVSMADDWRDALFFAVDGKSLAVTVSLDENETDSKPLGRLKLMFDPGATVRFKVTKAGIKIRHYEGSDRASAQIRTVKSGGEAEFTVYRDGTFEIVKEQPSGSTGAEEFRTIRYIVARPSRLVNGLTSGGLYSFNSRRTYALKQALDTNGVPIPNTNVIVGEGGGPSVVTALSGTMTYVFGESQGAVVSLLQKVASLGLFSEGGTEFGIFLGLTANPGSSSSVQVGFTFHLDRQEQFAISYGLNIVQSERLTRGLREGGTVTFSDLSDFKASKWVAAPFFSITYKLAG